MNAVRTCWGLLGKLKPLLTRANRNSYSQCGEDLIVEHALKWLGIPQPTYLDIGAFEPKYINNTYHFYRHGCRGVCVEPDPDSFRLLKLVRRRDVCLNVGIGISGESVTAPFYVMTSHFLNTFSEDDAKRYAAQGRERIECVVQIPTVPINRIVEQHFNPAPQFVSLDVEGLELQILKTLDFGRFRPQVFCVETITYSEDNTETKVEEIIQFMNGQGYFVYADTYLNTIFIDQLAWRKRGLAEAKRGGRSSP